METVKNTSQALLNQSMGGDAVRRDRWMVKERGHSLITEGSISCFNHELLFSFHEKQGTISKQY